MSSKRDLNCKECDGDGYIWYYLEGCGDLECFGGPWKLQCPYCDNDWDILDDEDNP